MSSRTGLRAPLYRGLRSAALAVIGPAAAITAVATAVGFLGAQSLLLDLASHFRMWYVVILAPVAAAAVLLRHGQTAALSIVALAANLLVIAPLFIRPGRSASLEQHGSALALLQFNVQTANDRKAAAADYVDSSGADLIFIQEVDDAWLEVLAERASRYRLIEAVPRDDNFGIAVLAPATPADHFEVVSSRVVALVADRPDRPAIELKLRWRDQTLDVLTLHTMPPRGIWAAEFRDRQLSACADWAQAREGAHIVVGDLNATMWSAAFKRLLSDAGLGSSERGFGYQGTWQAPWSWPFRIPIDHVLMSPELAAVERYVGPELGSDHRPLHLIVTLRRIQ